MLNGAAVAVALPFLDIFLDDNGEALAQTRAPLPTRFGTWFWGLGCNPQRWFPDQAGANYDLKVELEPIRPFQQKVNIFGGFPVLLDGKPNFPHNSGLIAMRTGIAAASPTMPGETFDVSIADTISAQKRFRSLDVALIGGSRNSISGRGRGSMNPSENSIGALYTRLFGDGFQDPNSGMFTPDPVVMARRSVLSAVGEQRRALESRLGAADRQRLDQYMTSVRQVENQLAVQLTPPEPMAACRVPEPVSDRPLTTDVESVAETHKIATALLLQALACDQTRVFNLLFSEGGSTLTQLGSTTTFHQLSHEEALDTRLGYQPNVTSFVNKIMRSWADFLEAADGIREGDGTLLDHMLVVAHSDVGFAKFHTIDDMPIMTAGGASGRVRTGLSIKGNGSPISRIGLTLQQVMGVPIESWGQGSMRTSNTISEMVA